MRRVIALIATVVAMLVITTPPGKAHEPYCGIRWDLSRRSTPT